MKYQTFHQVSEKTSQQTYSHQKTTWKAFQMPPRAIKHQLTCQIELTSGSSLIGRRGILVIPLWVNLNPEEYMLVDKIVNGCQNEYSLVVLNLTIKMKNVSVLSQTSMSYHAIRLLLLISLWSSGKTKSTVSKTVEDNYNVNNND